MNIFIKTVEVILSCETIEQLNVAYKYLKLANKYLDYNKRKLLSNLYFERRLKVV